MMNWLTCIAAKIFPRYIGRISIILLSLVISNPVYAGEVIPFQQAFSFSPYSSSRNDIINHFLLKIASGNNKLRVHTSYVFEGELDASAVRDAEGICHLNLRFRSFSFSGDVDYRAFSLEKMLVPDRMSFRLTVRRPDGSLILEQLFEGVSIPESGDISVRAHFQGWCLPNHFSLYLTDIQFYYSEVIFERFDIWFASLENYYEASELIRQLPGMLEELSYDDPETLIIQEFRLCEAESVLAQVRYARFHRWLNLVHGDPEGFLPVYKAVSVVIDSLRTGFNNSLSRIDEMLYEKAMRSFADQDHIRARALCAQVLVYNPVHVPSHLILTTYSLANDDLAGALDRITAVMSGMFPPLAYQAEARRVTEDVLRAAFDLVAELISANRFLDALGWLSRVEHYCEATSGLYACPEALTEMQRISHRGMFRSFMLVSERAFRNDNLSFCLTYLQSAIDYQRENAAFVPDRHEAENLLQRLLARHRELAARLQHESDEAGASLHLLTITEICERYDFLNCH